MTEFEKLVQQLDSTGDAIHAALCFTICALRKREIDDDVARQIMKTSCAVSNLWDEVRQDEEFKTLDDAASKYLWKIATDAEHLSNFYALHFIGYPVFQNFELIDSQTKWFRLCRDGYLNMTATN